MKVFILTEGGKNIGFGHITRCTALYQAFEERGIIPKFIVNGDDSVFDLLADKNYEIFDWIDEKERLLELIQNVDIAIIDSYLADISIYQPYQRLLKSLFILMIIKDWIIQKASSLTERFMPKN